jgi:hypothetical protein
MRKIGGLMERIPGSSVGERIGALAARYDRAVAQHLPRAAWMDQLESLILPARLVQPELDTFAALLAALPKRLPVEVG